MAHDAAAARITAEQREYAARHDLPALFTALLTGLVVHAPREPFAWLASEAERLRAAAAAGGPRAEPQPVRVCGGGGEGGHGGVARARAPRCCRRGAQP
jgi:hypothetical protein